MEDTDISQQSPVEQGYVPRPMWQVWAARVGLVLFLLFVVYELLALLGAGR